MTHEERAQEFMKLVSSLQDLLINKGREYTVSNDDVLTNFKSGSDIGVTSIQKLWIFLDKHLCSIKNYVKEGRPFSNEPIEGRIDDAICYLFLLRCLIKDQKGNHDL